MPYRLLEEARGVTEPFCVCTPSALAALVTIASASQLPGRRYRRAALTLRSSRRSLSVRESGSGQQLAGWEPGPRRGDAGVAAAKIPGVGGRERAAAEGCKSPYAKVSSVSPFSIYGV